MSHRPFAFSGMLLGAVIFACLMGYLLVSQNSISGDLNRVKAEFCYVNNNDIQNRQRCQRQLEQLIKDPTPEQARKLREIVREK